MNISSTFNVVDFYDYHPPDEPNSRNSRLSSFQVVETNVEQTTHTFLEQQRSQCKIKRGGVLVEAIGAKVLELHKIW